MTILDISRGGAQIETPFALQLDSLHDFRISLGERSIVVKGRIAHCHIGELKEGVVLYRTGVEFIEDLRPRAVGDRPLRRSAQAGAAGARAAGARRFVDGARSRTRSRLGSRRRARGGAT